MTLSPQAQAGWLQHDYGHLSVYRKPKWNHLVHKFVIGHLKVNVSSPGICPVGQQLRQRDQDSSLLSALRLQGDKAGVPMLWAMVTLYSAGFLSPVSGSVPTHEDTVYCSL